MIYVASKSKHGAMWREWRDAGASISATWIDESGEGETSDWGDLWSRCIAEAASASAFVMYVEPGEVHKGSLVELGAALHAGVPVYWVGPEVGSVRRARGVWLCESVTDALCCAEAHVEMAARREEATAIADVLEMEMAALRPEVERA